MTDTATQKHFIKTVASPLGDILLSSDGENLTGLWFCGSRYYKKGLEGSPSEAPLGIFDDAEKWLSVYFSGREPDFLPKVRMSGTEFQLAVWKKLTAIPYGKTVTYGEIAEALAADRGIERMSARAVGRAVGLNPVSVIVPCHRVVGADGSLTGFGGGIQRKISLLKLERTDCTGLFIPKKGTAL